MGEQFKVLVEFDTDGRPVESWVPLTEEELAQREVDATADAAVMAAIADRDAKRGRARVLAAKFADGAPSAADVHEALALLLDEVA